MAREQEWSQDGLAECHGRRWPIGSVPRISIVHSGLPGLVTTIVSAGLSLGGASSASRRSTRRVRSWVGMLVYPWRSPGSRPKRNGPSGVAVPEAVCAGTNVPQVLSAFADGHEMVSELRSNRMTENLIDFVVVALFGVMTALACIRFLRGPRNDHSSREEIEIGPAKPPEFKPPWRDMPHGDQAR
jgi:hypothetical protein